MKRMTVLTGFRMEALKQRDRKKYDRLNAVIGDGLKAKSDDVDFNSDLGAPKAIEPCPWCCPTTCANCSIEHCSDRLAGGANEIP